MSDVEQGTVITGRHMGGITFDVVIEETFFYIDPPYWDCETYYGKGIFGREDFALLAEQLRGIKGQFLLSLNDTPGVCEVFAGFSIEAVQTKYTCSNGKNVAAGEVFITKRR